MQQHLRILIRWRCITHDCGSYNYRNLLRHEMDSCYIIDEETVGVCKPKTFGTNTGDVARHQFNEWKDKTLNKEKERAVKHKWFAYRAKKLRDFYKKKYGNKFKGFQQNSREEKQDK